MQPCGYCGAPIALGTGAAGECAFCGTEASRPAAPVQVIQVVQAAPGASAPAELRCPHCAKLLVSVRIADVTLHGCGACAGIWVANLDAQRVIQSADRVFWELASRAARLATARRPPSPRPECPTCSAPLERREVFELILDVCADHGTWFDARELGDLVMKLRARRAEAAPAGPSIACVRCARTVPQLETVVGEEGALCQPCVLEIRLARLDEADVVRESALMALHRSLYPDGPPRD